MSFLRRLSPGFVTRSDRALSCGHRQGVNLIDLASRDAETLPCTRPWRIVRACQRLGRGAIALTAAHSMFAARLSSFGVARTLNWGRHFLIANAQQSFPRLTAPIRWSLLRTEYFRNLA